MKSVDPFAEFLAEALIGRLHVGKERVAPDLRYHPAPEDRAERRLLAPGDIAMPVVLTGFRILVVVDHHDLGVIRMVWCKGMNLEITEQAPESDMVLPADVLVAEKENLALEKRLSDLGHTLRRAIAVHAKASDLGTNGG